jgi:predicted dehydrogenase
MGLGSHVIDMARFLMGELQSVSAVAPTFNKQRPLGDANGPIVDVTAPDSFVAAVEFVSGAIGTVEASYVCAGRKNNLAWEVNGANGSLMWDVEDLNRLQVYGAGKDKLAGIAGFESVLVTESDHPYCKPWWAEGIGWENMHINMIQHFITAVVRNEPVAPYGATFEDGYKAAVIAEAIVESSATGRRLDLDYGL